MPRNNLAKLMKFAPAQRNMFAESPPPTVNAPPRCAKAVGKAAAESQHID
jgi:hypothetical protein